MYRSLTNNRIRWYTYRVQHCSLISIVWIHQGVDYYSKFIMLISLSWQSFVYWPTSNKFQSIRFKFYCYTKLWNSIYAQLEDKLSDLKLLDLWHWVLKHSQSWRSIKRCYYSFISIFSIRFRNKSNGLRLFLLLHMYCKPSRWLVSCNQI